MEGIMAVIFYKPNGEIYGTHLDQNISVPDDVSFIEIPGLPHEIVWPDLPNGSPGAEKYSRVTPGTKVLALRLDIEDVRPKTPGEAVRDMAQEPMFRALIARMAEKEGVPAQQIIDDLSGRA
jgi:hypothetical protein